MRIFDLMVEGSAKLFIPSVCITEALKHLEDLQRAWRSLAQRLQAHRGDITTARRLSWNPEGIAQVHADLVALDHQVERLLWNTLERVTQHAVRVDLDHRMSVATRRIREAFALSPADSVILATLVDCADQGVCSTFMSKDKEAFGRADVLTFFAEKAITYFASPADFLRSIRDDA